MTRNHDQFYDEWVFIRSSMHYGAMEIGNHIRWNTVYYYSVLWNTVHYYSVLSPQVNVTSWC